MIIRGGKGKYMVIVRVGTEFTKMNKTNCTDTLYNHIEEGVNDDLQCQIKCQLNPFCEFAVIQSNSNGTKQCTLRGVPKVDNSCSPARQGLYDVSQIQVDTFGDLS